MWVEKKCNRWFEKNSVRIFVLASASLCFVGPASAQSCAGKSGFAKAACEVAAKTGGSTSGAGIPPAVL